MIKLRCGSRGSQLALVQTQLVIDALQRTHPLIQIERLEVKTLGDLKQGTPQASHSDKKDWTFELELALLNHRIDFAVHSGKDIPYAIEPGTALLPVLTRGNPMDVFIGRKILEDGTRLKFADLPKGARIGTASLRRQAYLLQLRPDVSIIEHRGNVPTRVRKMDESPDLMGIVLASAGLDRLQLAGLTYEPFSAQEMLPAVNQGTLVVQFRVDDPKVRNAFLPLVNDTTYATWLAERTVAEILQGDCRSAIAIYAECIEDALCLSASVMLPDGSECIHAAESLTRAESVRLGSQVAHRLLELGAKKLIEKSRDY